MMTRREAMALPLAALAGCAGREPSPKIRVMAGAYFYLGGLYWAYENKYFTEEGLDVEVTQTQGSKTLIPLLSEGKADVACWNSNVAIINAVARGAVMKIVAGRNYYSPKCRETRMVFGSKKAFPNGFTHISQIKGKRVAYGGSGGNTSFQMDQAFKAAGLTRKDVTLVPLEDKEAALMVAAGKADVLFSATEEVLMTSLAEQVVAGPAYSDFVPEFMYSWMYFGSGMLARPVDQGVRFIRAFLRGQNEFIDGANPQFLKDFAKTNGLDEAKFLSTCRSDVDREGTIHAKDLQMFIDWAHEQGLCPTRVEADSMIDRRFWEGLQREKNHRG